jgi:mono/diheme cytochrome c family protein
MTVSVIQARPKKRLDERTQMCRLLSEGRLDWESEPWGRGGQKFQEVCKSCHTRNNDKGAPFLYAGSKMPEGWNRVFAKRRVQCAKDGSWGALSEEDIQFVNDYLYRNGAWTYDPNNADSCG